MVHIYMNETNGNVSHIEGLVEHGLNTAQEIDNAGDPDYSQDQQNKILLAISISFITTEVF